MIPMTFFIICLELIFILNFTNVQIGKLKKGLNPISITDFVFVPPHLTLAIKTGIVTGIIALAVSIFLRVPFFYYYICKTSKVHN